MTGARREGRPRVTRAASHSMDEKLPSMQPVYRLVAHVIRARVAATKSPCPLQAGGAGGAVGRRASARVSGAEWKPLQAGNVSRHAGAVSRRHAAGALARGGWARVALRAGGS